MLLISTLNILPNRPCVLETYCDLIKSIFKLSFRPRKYTGLKSNTDSDKLEGILFVLSISSSNLFVTLLFSYNSSIVLPSSNNIPIE